MLVAVFVVSAHTPRFSLSLLFFLFAIAVSHVTSEKHLL